MEYKGSVYGKINGKYIILTETVQDLEDKIKRDMFDNFYAWLDVLTQDEYDNMSLTEKCEKFFFK